MDEKIKQAQETVKNFTGYLPHQMGANYATRLNKKTVIFTKNEAVADAVIEERHQKAIFNFIRILYLLMTCLFFLNVGYPVINLMTACYLAILMFVLYMVYFFAYYRPKIKKLRKIHKYCFFEVPV